LYCEGWKQEEIRVAIDGPSGAYDDDPEQTGDSKPAGGECMATVTRVGINVVIQPDGRIWSAWPDAGSPGVVRNPRETK
jgi:hypothetical protein